MVGATGFEPATSSTPWKRAIQTALRPDAPGSIPLPLPTHLPRYNPGPRADVAQRIEHQSSELRAGGSNPSVRAISTNTGA